MYFVLFYFLLESNWWSSQREYSKRDFLGSCHSSQTQEASHFTQTQTTQCPHRPAQNSALEVGRYVLLSLNYFLQSKSTKYSIAWIWAYFIEFFQVPRTSVRRQSLKPFCMHGMDTRLTHGGKIIYGPFQVWDRIGLDWASRLLTPSTPCTLWACKEVGLAPLKNVQTLYTSKNLNPTSLICRILRSTGLGRREFILWHWKECEFIWNYYSCTGRTFECLSFVGWTSFFEQGRRTGLYSPCWIQDYVS